MEINLDDHEIIHRFARLHLRRIKQVIVVAKDSGDPGKETLWSSKNFPVEHTPGPPIEACTFGARLGNQSVFILDPRLKMGLSLGGGGGA